MRESIENLLFSGDEKINIKNATSQLIVRRDALLSVDEQDGEIARLRSRCAHLREALDQAIAHNREKLVLGAKLDKTKAERAEAERTLRELMDIDTCYRHTQLLLAFDKLHDIRRQTNEVSVKLQSLKQSSSRSGFIPDAEYLTELEVNRRLYLEAVKSKEQYAAALERVENAEIVDVDIQRHLQRTIRRGGEEEVLAGATKLYRKTAFARFSAILMAALALACVVTAIWILPSEFPNAPSRTTLPYYLGLGIGALLLAGIDVGLWIFAHSEHQKERNYCIDYGAKNHAELRLRMRSITESRNRYADHIMELRATRQNRDKAAADCITARETLAATIKRFGIVVPDDEDILPYADKVDTATRSYLATLAQLREEKSRLDATASQLRDQLRGQNESAIRAKVPPESLEKMKQLKPAEIAGSIAATKLRAETLAQEEDMYAANLSLLLDHPEDAALLAEQLSDAEQALQVATEQHRALSRALSAFSDADDRLKARITPRLQAHVLELIRAISGGRYDDLEMGDDLSLKLKQHGDVYPPDLISSGTRDIVYIALRMAMIAMVCRDQYPPLCLDESFAYLDDTRALGVMRALKLQADKGMQHLIFTCRAREEILAHQAFGPRIGYSKLEGHTA